MRPSVSILLLNYNRPNDTIECVRSLEKCAYQSKEIIIVDNGSTDDSLTRLRSEFPDLDIVPTGANLGFTGGTNFSLRHALRKQPDYALLLNNDTVVTPDFLGHLVDAMEQNPNAAAACSTILCDHERSRIWYAGGKMIPWRGMAVHLGKDEIIDLQQLDGARNVTFVTGCVMLLRSSLLESVGLLDERLFMFLDDIEYSARILSRGYDLLYVPQSIVYHKVLGEKQNRFKLYYSVRNRMLVITSAFQGFTRIFAATYFLFVITLKLLVWRFTNREFFTAGWYGLQDFFSGKFQEGRGLSHVGYR